MTTNHVITGVWFKENKKGSEHISHVMLHDYTNGNISKGTKVDKDFIINILKTKTIITVKWNYKDGIWQWGSKVTVETRNTITYLRTVSDDVVTNNLDNIINMNII